MKFKNKKFLAALTALVMTLSCGCHMAMAEETETEEVVEIAEEVVEETTISKVEFVLSEPDEDGYLTASLIIYDAEFSAGQFGFSFDNSVLQFVNKDTKEPSEVFSEVSTLYSLKNESGEHKFSELDAFCIASNKDGKLEIGFYGYESVLSDESAIVEVDDNGFKVYDFTFKMLKKENPSFKVLDYESKIYPKNAILMKGGEGNKLTLSFILPESLNEEVESAPYFPVEPEKSLKEKRKERLVDSLILNIGNYAAVDDGYLKWIDDNNKNVVPFIEDDRTYVPLRFIGEAFDAEVNWNADAKEITINLGETVIKMNIGKKEYTVNGEIKEMDVAPFIREDRTIVPVRFVSEALDKAVYWDPGMKLVIVTPSDRPWDPDGEAEKDILPDALLIMSELVRDIKPEAE